MVKLVNNLELDIIYLYSKDYKASFHIREMAKLINKSHVSLLPYLKEFEKRNILVSKIIGKNKIFSINLNNPEVIEFLCLSEKKKTLELLEKNEYLKEFYKKFNNFIIGCLILLTDSININNKSLKFIVIGELNERKKQEIKELAKIYSYEINILSGSLDNFKLQLKNKTNLANEIIKNHVILINHDTFIKELFNYYQNYI